MENELDRETRLEELFEQVRAAAEAFYRASGDQARVTAEFGGMLDHPDGATAVLQAARHEQKALLDYNLAIKTLSDFLALPS